MNDLLCLSLCFLEKGRKVSLADPQDALESGIYQEGVFYTLETEIITAHGYQDIADLLDEDDLLTEEGWLEEAWTEVGFGRGHTPYDFQNATAYWRDELGAENFGGVEKLFRDLNLYAQGSPYLRVITLWKTWVKTSYNYEFGAEEVDYIESDYCGLLDLAKLSPMELPHV